MIVRKQGSLLLTLDSCENRAAQNFHAFPQFFCYLNPRLRYLYKTSCCIHIALDVDGCILLISPRPFCHVILSARMNIHICGSNHHWSTHSVAVRCVNGA